MRRFVFVAILLFAAAANADLTYNPDFFVYTLEGGAPTPFREGEVRALFDRLLAGDKPVVLFVHGRGDEPQKSLVHGTLTEGQAVRKLEEYGVRVVMLSWDSKKCCGIFRPTDRTRPLGNVPAGAERLKSVLTQLAQSAAAHPQHPRLTLLAHSMGTIVVQKYVETNGWAPGGGRLFDNVVLSSADADNIGHSLWVDKIAAVERVSVTVNPKDTILPDSKKPRQPGAVALGLNPGQTRSTKATYINVSVQAHEIFTKRADHPEVSGFFDAVFRGQAPQIGTRASRSPSAITGRVRRSMTVTSPSSRSASSS